MISNAAFAQLMQQINLPSAAAEYDRFALYCTQLQEWNQRMNLTAITQPEGIARLHFLDSAALLLHQQGYVLEVTVRGDTAVQVTASDGSGHPCEDNSIIENAMTAAGFTASGDWYVLTQEETQ